MPTQTKWESFKEQLYNIGSGFFLSYLVWIFIVNPLITQGHLTINDSLLITSIFTVTSLLRSFVWRRVFNHISVKKYKASKATHCPHVPLECHACLKERVLQIDFSEDANRGIKRLKR